jgi:hypothetical protein
MACVARQGFLFDGCDRLLGRGRVRLGLFGLAMVVGVGFRDGFSRSDRRAATARSCSCCAEMLWFAFSTKSSMTCFSQSSFSEMDFRFHSRSITSFPRQTPRPL